MGSIVVGRGLEMPAAGTVVWHGKDYILLKYIYKDDFTKLSGGQDMGSVSIDGLAINSSVYLFKNSTSQQQVIVRIQGFYYIAILK